MNFSNLSASDNLTSNISETYHITYAIFFSIVALATVTGNILLFYTILSSSQLRTATNSLLLSLATADLVAGSVMVPLYVQLFVSGRKTSDSTSRTLCLIRKFLFLLTSGASITSLAVVSVDRMFAVSRPFVYARVMTAKLVTFIIVSVWTVCLTLTSCAVFIPLSSWDSFLATCRPGVPRISYLTVTPALFYLPGVVILLSYIKIFTIARTHRRKITIQNEPSVQPAPLSVIELSNMREENVSTGRPRAITLTTSSSKKTSTTRMKRISRIRNTLSNDIKAAKTVSILVGLFLACWLPVASFYLYLNSTGTRVTSNRSLRYVHDAFMCLSFLNAAIDPILYIFLNKDIKRALKSKLRGLLKLDNR